MVTREKLHSVMAKFNFRGKEMNLHNMGYIADVIIKDEEVGCVLNVTEENQEIIVPISQEIQRLIQNIEGVKKTNIVFTGEKAPKQQKEKIRIPGVKDIILVSSGKGGVGKSTIAFMLAKQIKSEGQRVGILDADIYGPSIPTLTCISGQPKVVGGQMIPHDYNSIQVNSMGYLIPGEKALSWRGPMITKALHQLLYTTKWDNLDYLVVDMPPGTGDIHLTICDKYHISGVVMVSTPQILSVSDLSRAIDMYRKFSVPVLGIVKNMSYVKYNQEKKYIFGRGEELEKYSKDSEVKILCEIPLDAELLSSHNNLNIITTLLA